MTTSLTPPPPDASPAAVRGYFTTLLHTLHSVPEPEAARIAVKWQFGRGSELRYYDITTFREIFGVEAGTVLFGHARGELGNGGNGLGKGGSGAGQVGNVGVGMRIVRGKEKPAKDIFGITPGLSLVYLLFAMSVLFGSSAWFAVTTDRAAGMTILATFSTFGFISAYVGFYFL